MNDAAWARLANAVGRLATKLDDRQRPAQPRPKRRLHPLTCVARGLAKQHYGHLIHRDQRHQPNLASDETHRNASQKRGRREEERGKNRLSSHGLTSENTQKERKRGKNRPYDITRTRTRARWAVIPENVFLPLFLSPSHHTPEPNP